MAIADRSMSLRDALAELQGKRVRLVTTASVAGAALNLSRLEKVGFDYVVVAHGETKIIINLIHIVAAWSAE